MFPTGFSNSGVLEFHWAKNTSTSTLLNLAPPLYPLFTDRRGLRLVVPCIHQVSGEPKPGFQKLRDSTFLGDHLRAVDGPCPVRLKFKFRSTHKLAAKIEQVHCGDQAEPWPHF